MNKLFKRVVAVSLATVMTAGAFAGCSAKAPEADKTFKVGVCQIVEHPALDEATKGFEDTLKAEFGDKVTVEVQNAGNDIATCATICNGFVSGGYDLIMANATPSLQAAMQATTTIPIVGTSITSYGVALDIEDMTNDVSKVTGINITGSSDLAPLADQAKMIKDLCPDAKTVGILYCTAEPNSVFQATAVSKELESLGLTSKEYTVADSNEVASVTQSACDECDVIYIPTDNTMASSTGTIEPIVTKANKPVFAGEEGIAKGCGVATLSISYYAIGQKAGEMAIDILKNGKNPAEMEIQYDTAPVYKYVESRAKDFGITIPDTYEAIDMTAE